MKPIKNYVTQFENPTFQVNNRVDVEIYQKIFLDHKNFGHFLNLLDILKLDFGITWSSNCQDNKLPT